MSVRVRYAPTPDDGKVKTAFLGLGWKEAAALPLDAAVLGRIYDGIRAAYLSLRPITLPSGKVVNVAKCSTPEGFDLAVDRELAVQEQNASVAPYRRMGPERARVNAAAVVLRRAVYIESAATRALAALEER